MDVAFYWKQTKSLSKKLTGVEKLSPNFFSRSANITNPLEKYVIGWMQADEKEYTAQGQKALNSIEKYLDTILNKEIKDKAKKAKGKDGMSPEELKSAKIIQSNLELIRQELKDVLAGKKKPGNFKRDVEEDTSAVAADPKTIQVVEDKIKSRDKMAKIAAGYTAAYQQKLVKLQDMAKRTEAGMAAAKAASAKNDPDSLEKAIRVIEQSGQIGAKIFADIDDHYKKNVISSEDFRIAREDVQLSQLDLVSKSLRKAHNDAYGRLDKENRAALAIRADAEKLLRQINSIEVAADNLDPAIATPAKARKRIDKLLADAEAARADLRLWTIKNQTTAKKLQHIVQDRVGAGHSAQEILRAIGPMQKQVATSLTKCEAMVKVVVDIDKWLGSAMTKINEPSVLADAERLAQLVEEAQKYAKTYASMKKDIVAALKASQTELRQLAAAA